MRLTKPLLEAIQSALNAALAGEGFEGGDFERALQWAYDEEASRTRKAAERKRGRR